MSNFSEKTIIQEIQPHCNDLHLKLKKQKDLQHMTNQEIADITGLPLSNVSKFFSGSLSLPSVFNVMAICICLNQSLDALFDNKAEQSHDNELEEKVLELEKENNRLKQELKIAQIMAKNNDSDIKRVESGLKERTRVIYSLLILCGIISFSLFVYLGIDLSNSKIGFVRDAHISPILIVIIAAIIIIIGVTIHLTLKIKQKKDDDV